MPFFLQFRLLGLQGFAPFFQFRLRF